MGQADFRHGSPLMVDHTPSSAVSAGDVVVQGEYTFVAHLDIAASAIGAVAAGGGVYEMTADADLAPGTKVFWDASAGKITVTVDSGNNKHFGFLPIDSDPNGDGDKVKVVHDPDGSSV